MPPALTPALAVDYVRELSADVRAVVVLDAHGDLAAGPEPLAAPARALLDAGGAAELEAVTAAGVVCAVRSATHAAVAVCGRLALPGVTREDLRAAVAALAGEPSPPAPDAVPDPPDRALLAAAERLISAAQSQSEA